MNASNRDDGFFDDAGSMQFAFQADESPWTHESSKVLVAGSKSREGFGRFFAMARFNADGTLDSGDPASDSDPSTMPETRSSTSSRLRSPPSRLRAMSSAGRRFTLP